MDDHRRHLPLSKSAVHHGATAARGGGEKRSTITDSEAMEQVGQGHGGIARCSAAGAILASNERVNLQYTSNVHVAAKKHYQSCSYPYTNSLWPPSSLQNKDVDLNRVQGIISCGRQSRGGRREPEFFMERKEEQNSRRNEGRGRVGIDLQALMRTHTQATLIPPAMQSQHAHHCILKGLVQHPGGRESRSFYHILLQMRKYSSPCPLPVHVPGCIFVRLSSTEVEH